jgi:hypothetical protein
MMDILSGASRLMVDVRQSGSSPICALIFVSDVAVLNLVGEVSSGWWLLAVPLGLLLVPLVGIVALVLLLQDRRRAKLP